MEGTGNWGRRHLSKKHHPYNICVWGDLGWMLEKGSLPGGWLDIGTGSPGQWLWH